MPYPTLFDVPETKIELTEKEQYKFGKGELKDYLRSSDNPLLKPFVDILLEYKKVAKQISTYGEKFLDAISEDGRARSQYSQVYTTTGRLSSSSFSIGEKDGSDVREGYNAQNIPKSKALRNCFIADPGYMIATIDYSGQETVLAASQSKDKLLLDLALHDADIHSILATESFRIIYQDDGLIVAKDKNVHLRNQHKGVLFALFYGAGAKRIQIVLNTTPTKAKAVYAKIREMMPAFFKYQDIVQDRALRLGYVDDNTKYRRRRTFPVGTPDHKKTKQASNYPMQSSGASMVKEALVACDAYLETFRAEYPLIGVIGQVHDEIIFQIPKDRKDIAERCVAIMEEVGITSLE
jgi:DNA polymerase-1